METNYKGHDISRYTKWFSFSTECIKYSTKTVKERARADCGQGYHHTRNRLRYSLSADRAENTSTHKSSVVTLPLALWQRAVT